MNLFEGGNAKAKNGAEATKVDIKSLNDKLYESFKQDMLGVWPPCGVCL